MSMHTCRSCGKSFVNIYSRRMQTAACRESLAHVSGHVISMHVLFLEHIHCSRGPCRHVACTAPSHSDIICISHQLHTPRGLRDKIMIGAQAQKLCQQLQACTLMASMLAALSSQHANGVEPTHREQIDPRRDGGQTVGPWTRARSGACTRSLKMRAC